MANLISPRVSLCALLGEHVTSWFKNEVERMGFDTQNAWRISDINSKFRYAQPTAPANSLHPTGLI